MATGQYRDPSIVTARPVVPGPIAEYTQPWALTTGSQINKPAKWGPYVAGAMTGGSSINKARQGAPWPGIINGAIKFFNSWKPNALREISNHNVGGNYGSETGRANFGWRHFEFDPMQAQALYPGTVPTVHRPMWNVLVPIVYGLRVLNPAQAGQNGIGGQVPQSVVSQFTQSVQFTPAGSASIASRAVTLQ
jgi:hypothetical protein